MKARLVVRWSILFGFCLALSALGYAQTEAVHGQVTDGGGKPIPGAIVKAVNNGTGETEQAQTDKDGLYRIPLRTGNFTITSSVTGFGKASQTMDLLVGAQPEIDFKMAAGEQAEVTAAAPVTNANNGNVTQQQVESIPSNGRNQIDLTLQAPRSDSNYVVNDVFVAYGSSIGGNSQIIMDGQQVTTIIAQGMGQPKFSKDAVEQMQMGDRFDATQGRSSKLIVNEVYKSGTNQFLGRASGYFRSDIFNSPDYLTINPTTQNYRTLPYSDQQISFTFGGPIIKNKLHFFANYEYERNPTSFPYSSPWAPGAPLPGTNLLMDNVPLLNQVVTVPHTIPSFGGRVDWQLRGQDHAMFRYNHADENSPINWNFYNGTSNEPASTESVSKFFSDYYGSFTQVLSSKSVNVIKGGYTQYGWAESQGVGPVNKYSAYSGWNGNPPTQFAGVGQPSLTFTVASGPGGAASPANGFIFGQEHAGSPEWVEENTWTARDDYSHTFDWHGGHTLKTGGEWLRKQGGELFQGTAISGSVALTIPYNLSATLPQYFTAPGGAEGSGIYDVSTWNLAPLSQYVTSINKSVLGPQPTYWMLRNYFAGWAQDDWRVTPKLTLAYGVRYDIGTNMFAESEATPGIFNSGRPIPKNGIGPRVGFTYKLTNSTILRGGYGRYFADVGMQTGGNAGARQNEWNVAAQEQYIATSAASTPPGTGFDGITVPTIQSLIQAAPPPEGYTSSPEPGTGNPTMPAQTNPTSILANYCVNNNSSGMFSINATGTAGCVRPTLGTPAGLGGLSWSNNANMGIEKLLGKGWIVNSDFYFEGLRHGTGSSAANMLWYPDGTNAPFVGYVNGANPCVVFSAACKAATSNNPAIAFNRPYPNFGTFSIAMDNTLSNYLGFTNTIIKRAGPFTGSLTWTWSELRDGTESTYGVSMPTGQATPFAANNSILPSIGTTNGIQLLPFQVAKGYEGLNYYSYAGTDQRNRANFNFLVKLSHGVSLSGLYFFGSGQALAESYGFGGNGVEDDGGAGSAIIMPFNSGTFNYQTNQLPNNNHITETTGSIRTDGGVSPGGAYNTLCAGGANAPSVPGNTTENPGFNAGCLLVRNGFHPRPIDRVDARLTKTIKMGERVNTDIFVESFNLLNHENFGSWNTNVKSSGLSASQYGLPAFNLALPFQARMAQFGFKVDFKL